jgi:phosphoglycolate phosphatase-like HAD superfamily hydrolase
MPVRFVIFDLDDTLVHSAAVRCAFRHVAARDGIPGERVEAVCDRLPGRSAFEIFEALGLARDDAADAAVAFLARLEQLNSELPPVAYTDADATLRAMLDSGLQLFLSTGSSGDRAHRVLRERGWEGFELVLGSEGTCRKGPDHFEAVSAHLGAPRWAGQAATISDSPQDMREGAEQGVPVRIGLSRRADDSALRAAGATHVVERLADAVPIVLAA